jgi:hypothetical protein
MSLRTFVSFKAAFPTDGQPAGKELADFIAAALADAGIVYTGPVNREDWAWEIHSQVGEIDLEMIVGYVDDDPRDWLITQTAHLPILARLFGGSLEKRTAALRPLCNAIDSAIKSDSRFSEIRWYLQRDFEKDHGDTWADSP